MIIFHQKDVFPKNGNKNQVYIKNKEKGVVLPKRNHFLNRQNKQFKRITEWVKDNLMSKYHPIRKVNYLILKKE